LFVGLLVAFFIWSRRFERSVVNELNAEGDADGIPQELPVDDEN
jgi:hypothetical protein